MSFDGLRLQATGPRRAVLLLALLCFVAFFVNNGFLRPDIMETRNLERRKLARAKDERGIQIGETAASNLDCRCSAGCCTRQS